VSFTDKTLTCRACGKEFVFTAGEQEFFQEKGLLNEPQRCQECRAARRAQSGGLGGRVSSGERAPREMHKVVCAECGMETEVPFFPKDDRPVYCSACYDKVKVRARR
jgi:CxxC-x17-CxxC domain-containing protein